MNQEKINFRQSRDFGETFNVSVTFLRQNFKLFFMSLILIAGPFVLISAIAGAFYQSHAISLFSITALGKSNGLSGILNQFGWEYVLFILATVVSSLMIVNTVYSYMLTYMEKGPGGFAVNDVTQTVIKNITNVLSVFIVFTVFIILFLVIVVGIIIGISAAVPVLGILLIFLLFIGLLIIMPPLMWLLSAIYIVKMHEGQGVFESYARAKEIMRGNFWWTWVIIVCAGIAVIIANFIFAIPQAGYQMVLMFSRLKGSNEEVSISFLVVATLCTFCTSILYSVLYVVCGFHYFSLAEKKDGLGLLERIDEIGTTPNNNVDQQY